MRIRFRRPGAKLSGLNDAELSNVKSRLENSIDRLGPWIHRATILVVLGLGIEYWGPLAKFFATHEWRYVVDCIGGILVTLGVAGEMLLGFRAAAKDGRLREVNSTLFARAEERIAVLHKEAALALESAENERLERLKLQKALAGRTLPGEDFDRIAQNLLQFSGQAFVMSTDSSNLEQVQFARSIHMALINAGWSFENLQAPTDSPRMLAEGVLIQPTPDERSQEAARALGRDLLESGHVVIVLASTYLSWICRNEQTGMHDKSRVWIRIADQPRPPTRS
jgi:hypothetical protein